MTSTEKTPTVNCLEAKAAEIFAREVAIFVPTGTMGNQIAILMHTEHGQEVICESRSHIADWELATASTFSGCQLRTIRAERGILTWMDIQYGLSISSKRYDRAQTDLIALENTHNMAGGKVTPAEIMRRIVDGAAGVGYPFISMERGYLMLQWH